MRLIDADTRECWACIHHATGECDTWCECGECFQLREDVKNAPTIPADVHTVRHGEWIKTSEFMPIYGCSICGQRNLFRDGNNVLSPFCPNCGAKMDL